MGKRAKHAEGKKSIKVIIVIIAILLVGIIVFKMNDLIVFGKNKTINLVINNKNVTSNLKKDVLIRDDKIYLSKQDLGNFFDKYIYEEIGRAHV